MTDRLGVLMFTAGASIALACGLAVVLSCLAFGVADVLRWCQSPTPQPYANIGIGLMVVGVVLLNVGALLLPKDDPDS